MVVVFVFVPMAHMVLTTQNHYNIMLLLLLFLLLYFFLDLVPPIQPIIYSSLCNGPEAIDSVISLVLVGNSSNTLYVYSFSVSFNRGHFRQ